MNGTGLYQKTSREGFKETLSTPGTNINSSTNAMKNVNMNLKNISEGLIALGRNVTNMHARLEAVEKVNQSIGHLNITMQHLHEAVGKSSNSDNETVLQKLTEYQNFNSNLLLQGQRRTDDLSRQLSECLKQLNENTKQVSQLANQLTIVNENLAELKQLVEPPMDNLDTEMLNNIRTRFVPTMFAPMFAHGESSVHMSEPHMDDSDLQDILVRSANHQSKMTIQDVTDTTQLAEPQTNLDDMIRQTLSDTNPTQQDSLAESAVIVDVNDVAERQNANLLQANQENQENSGDQVQENVNSVQEKQENNEDQVQENVILVEEKQEIDNVQVHDNADSLELADQQNVIIEVEEPPKPTQDEIVIDLDINEDAKTERSEATTNVTDDQDESEEPKKPKTRKPRQKKTPSKPRKPRAKKAT